MRYNPDIHHRCSIRLKWYDYSSNGIYFVTICTQNRENLFGEILNTRMILNKAGKMIESIYLKIPMNFENIILREYIIMPNHFHGIIEICNTHMVGADSISALNTVNIRADMESAPTNTTKLSQVIQTFKRHSTIEYIKMVKQNVLPCFHKRIWQRNYHEHIVRNEFDYYKIAEYIKNNPVLWEKDCYRNI
jgi:putative transposase